MPRDTIERAIKRGAGGEGENYEEVRYEGYGPGGVAVIVEALTDNRNRTAGEVRSTFAKHGGDLGETNSVELHVRPRRRDPLSGRGGRAPTTVLEEAIEAGADDVRERRGGRTRSSARPDELDAVREALEERSARPAGGQLSWRPQDDVPVDGETGQTLLDMIEALDDNDDVQSVYANFEVSDGGLLATG